MAIALLFLFPESCYTLFIEVHQDWVVTFWCIEENGAALYVPTIATLHLQRLSVMGDKRIYQRILLYLFGGYGDFVYDFRLT